MSASEVPNKGDPTGRHEHQPQAPQVVVPPAPPGESVPEDVLHTRAVAEALTQLGQGAEPRVIAEHLKRGGVNISPEEVAVIKSTLIGRAAGGRGSEGSGAQEEARQPAGGGPAGRE